MMTTLKNQPRQSQRDSRHRLVLGSGEVFPDLSPSGALRSVEPCGRVGRLKPGNTSPRRSAQRGFALVVVLLLSSLLVAMLVALVTMTLAESRTVRATAKLHLARAHALEGLKHAVDTLQTGAGRDQCRTAPASLTMPNSPNPWWVSAWQRYKDEPETTTWLISGAGNEPHKAFNVESANTVLPTPSKTEQRTVWLARHSVNDRDELSVKAAKVGIVERDNPLALRSKKPVRTGSYAWWASDESMKAKANLSAPASGYSDDNAQRELSWQLASAPRSAPWKMEGLNALPKDDVKTERVLSLDQLPLLTKSPDKLTDALEDHFHDLTTDSLGVICNTRKGGLRRDLSLAFEMNDDAFYTDPVFGPIKPGISSVVTSGRNIGLGGEAGLNSRDINWRVFRDYYQLWRRVGKYTPDTLRAQPHIAFPDPDQKTGPAEAKEAALSANKFLMNHNKDAEGKDFEFSQFLLAQKPSLTTTPDDDKISPRTTSIVPQVVRNQHVISVIAQPAPWPADSLIPADDQPLNKMVVVINPVITLWNPYNVKLSTQAVRIDDRLPEVHVMIEVQQPWKQNRYYAPQEEVYDRQKDTIFRAIAPSKGKSTGDKTFWQDQGRKWSIGADRTLREILHCYKASDSTKDKKLRVDRTSLILTGDGVATGQPTDTILEPGEFAVFGVAEKQVQTFEDGEPIAAMKRGNEVSGGLGFDRLPRLMPPEDSKDGGDSQDTPEIKREDLWLRVYPETTIRVTVEPYRRSLSPPEKTDPIQLWKTNDPFEFMKTYHVVDDENTPLEELNLNELRYPPRKSMDQDTTPYLPSDYSVYLGRFTGGDKPINSFAWSGTAMGDFIHTRYDTRAYHGHVEDESTKPLPGQGDEKTASDILAEANAESDKRIWAGVWDWYWKTETDLTYPAQAVQRFNPRFGILTQAPALKEDPAHRSGFPCTVAHYQVDLSKFQGWGNTIEQDGSHRSYWGPSHSSLGEQYVPLFEVPTAPMLSVGQFQHCLTSISPLSSGYGIGSSWPSPFIPRETDTMSYKFDTTPPVTLDLVDSSYLLNEQLFDDYFFSSISPYASSMNGVSSRLSAITAETKPKSLPNSRLSMHWPADIERKKIAQELDPTSTSAVPPYQKAAAYMMIDGPFNVNSTSVEAWKAVLAGGDGLKVPIYPGGSQGVSESVISRLTVPNGKPNNYWRGFRSLTDAELQSLAEQIVIEVKARGPFLSMAEFVNRRLTDGEKGLSGTLQAAIDRTSINGHLKAQVTEGALQHAAAQHEADTPEWSFPYPAHATGPVMAGQVGFLQQGDILQALAPILTVRGDTFKVRTYGEVLNPATGAIEARAWCEAIVQRMPEYLNRTANGKVETNPDPPWAMPDESSPDDKSSLEPKIQHELNKTLGRTYRVMHLRWLSPDEV